MKRQFFYNRVAYIEVTKQWMQEVGAQNLDACEISGSNFESWGFKSHQSFEFPDYDICQGPFKNEDGTIRQFDIILAEQVWEHIDRPYAATKHVMQMLRPGGFFWLAVPFFCRLHDFPVDCSRWSARGLKNLLIECGFDENEIRSDQWGNMSCALRDLSPFWAIYDPARDTLENDPNMPVMTWAMARLP